MLHLLAAIHYIELDVSMLNRVVALFLPLLVALVTKKVTSQGLKSSLLFVFSAIAGLATTMIQADGRIPVAQVIDAMLTTLVTAVAVYYGLWKPTGIAGSITEKTANFGIGSPPGPVMETADKGQEDVGAAQAEILADGPLAVERPKTPRVKRETKKL